MWWSLLGVLLIAALAYGAVHTVVPRLFPEFDTDTVRTIARCSALGALIAGGVTWVALFVLR